MLIRILPRMASRYSQNFTPACRSMLRVVVLTVLLCAVSLAQAVLEGTVRDTSGSPVAAAKVRLRHAEGKVVAGGTTDASGNFHFGSVDAGSYTLEVEDPEYYPANYSFVLRARQPLLLNVELQRKNPLQQTVEVRASQLTIDPQKTGRSY